MRAPLLVAVLTLTVLAGCLSGEDPPETTEDDTGPGAIAALLSQPLGTDIATIHEALDIPTPHGSVRVDLYRPDLADVAPDWKSPIILVASPYNNPNNILGGGKDPQNEHRIGGDLDVWMERELLPRGYALAYLDLLGTRDSGGCNGVMHKAERVATATAIDHLGGLEWTNGRVGMIGKSYVGASQVFAAIENPEHLVTIVPISPVTNAYAYHYRNGVPYLLNQATNALYNGVFSLPPPTDDPTDDPAFYATRMAERLPCIPESVVEGADPTGDYDARWAERDARPHIADQRSDISVLFVHGHQDWNVKPDHVLGIYDQYPATHKTAIIGQWHHDHPDNNRWDNDTHGSRLDWWFMLHRWFDHHLLDIDSGLMTEIAACPVQTQGYDAVWRCNDDWPPRPEEQIGSDDGMLRLWPTADGGLGAEPGSGTAMYADAPVDGTLPNEHVFTSAPLEEPLRIAGIPRLGIRLETTSPFNTFVIAAIGVERNGTYDELDWAFHSLRHRDGVAAPAAVLPATPYDLVTEFYPLDMVFETGDRIELRLRGYSTDEPNLGVIPNPTPGVQTVHLDMTHLDLPAVADDRRFAPLAVEALPERYWPLEK